MNSSTLIINFLAFQSHPEVALSKLSNLIKKEEIDSYWTPHLTFPDISPQGKLLLTKAIALKKDA